MACVTDTVETVFNGPDYPRLKWREWSWPVRRLVRHVSSVTADILLADGCQVAITNDREQEHVVVSASGDVIERIEARRFSRRQIEMLSSGKMESPAP